MRERPSAGPGPDNDDVVMLVHGPTIASGTGRGHPLQRVRAVRYYKETVKATVSAAPARGNRYPR